MPTMTMTMTMNLYLWNTAAAGHVYILYLWNRYQPAVIVGRESCPFCQHNFQPNPHDRKFHSKSPESISYLPVVELLHDLPAVIDDATAYLLVSTTYRPTIFPSCISWYTSCSCDRPTVLNGTWIKPLA